MRLVDRVMASDSECVAKDPRGNLHIVPGPSSVASLIDSCALRYIVDPTASSQCADLLTREADLFDPENPMLRAPAPLFWMEWFQDEFAGNSSGPRQRLGVLVEASPDGRSGTLRYFFETVDGEIGSSPLIIEFDLDQQPRPDPVRWRFRLTHGDIDYLDVLLRHCVLYVDRGWVASLTHCTTAERSDFVSIHAGAMWLAFPIMLAFGALLGDGRVLSERKSDLAKLNAARQKGGKRPLLEHVEVSLNLGEILTSSRAPTGQMASGRSTPRLHYVRGHSVKRAGKIFWRTAHFRGDAERPILTRTVNVRGRG